METIRISDTVQEFNGERFYMCGNYFQHKGKRLHRAVWEHHNGEIPKGYHIHHKDKDRGNNSIENLELVKSNDHLSRHMTPEKREWAKQNVKKAIEAAPKWHRSEAGREWHSEHSKKAWESRKPTEYVCDFCGRKYESLNISHIGNHFCSNNCKAAFRRNSGVDNETRVCVKCGEQFVTNKYSKARFCSLTCARHSRKWRNE